MPQLGIDESSFKYVFEVRFFEVRFNVRAHTYEKTKKKTLKTYLYLPTYLTLDSPVPKERDLSSWLKSLLNLK